MSKSTYLHMYKCILVCLPLLLVFLSTCILGSLSTCQHVFSFVYFYCLSTCLLILSTNLLVFLSTCLRFILSICLLVFVYTGLLFIFSTCLRYNTFYLFYLSTCFLSTFYLIYLHTYLPVTCLLISFHQCVYCLFIYLSACVHVALEPFLLSLSLPRLKRAESGGDRQLGRAYLTLVPGTGFPASFTHQQ